MVIRSLVTVFRRVSRALRKEQGMTLIELLVALAILSLVAVVYLDTMSTTSMAIVVSQDRVVVESLGKSQMEYVLGQSYDAAHNPPQYTKLAAGDIPDGYDITLTAERLDPAGNGTGNDDGLQRITVDVTHNGATELSLQGYKMNR